jgi:hypothetical protein
MILFQPAGHFTANWTVRDFMLAHELAAGTQYEARPRISLPAGWCLLVNGRDAPACMRCRGLTGSRHATDLPIPRLIPALPDRHLADSPFAISGPPASRRPSGLPPRWPAVQVVNDFLLPAPTGAQGLSSNLSKILLPSTVRRLLSPAIVAYPPDTHSFCTAAGKRRASVRSPGPDLDQRVPSGAQTRFPPTTPARDLAARVP